MRECLSRDGAFFFLLLIQYSRRSFTGFKGDLRNKEQLAKAAFGMGAFQAGFRGVEGRTA